MEIVSMEPQSIEARLAHPLVLRLWRVLLWLAVTDIRTAELYIQNVSTGPLARVNPC